MKQTRKKPAVRRDEILTRALELAAEQGYLNVTCKAIAAACGIKRPTIRYYFETAAILRAALVERAIEEGNLAVVAQALVARDPLANQVPEGLRLRALSAV